MKPFNKKISSAVMDRNRIKVRSTASGVHLFNRVTGTNILFDELRTPPENYALAPRHVSVALTNACDLACEYCYAPKSSARLPLETLKSWLLELDDNGTIGVGFGGGEPTLYPKLPDLCRFMIDETRLAVTLTTHGHRLDADLLHRLRGNINFVRVSMDGVGETYEANRGRPFADLIEKIKQIRDIAPFGINYVVNSCTIADLDEAIDMASRLSAREFLLLPERPVSLRPGIDEQTLLKLKGWIVSYGGKVPLSVCEDAADGLPTCDPLPLESGLAAFAHIDATGTLKRTSFAETGVKVGEKGIIHALQALEQSVEVMSK